MCAYVYQPKLWSLVDPPPPINSVLFLYYLLNLSIFSPIYTSYLDFMPYPFPTLDASLSILFLFVFHLLCLLLSVNHVMIWDITLLSSLKE